MNNLSAEQMAGRLVIGRVPALVLDQSHKNALAEGKLGGITLFKENADNLEQLAQVAHDIIEASFHAPILTVDQEGGAVQRFDHVLTSLPSPMALAASASKEVVEAITAISCRQLKALGFNLLLAPTLDLLTNPLNPVIGTRAFSDSVDLATNLGSQVIDEIEKSGLVACPKHYPGHGSTSQDSHLELAVVDKSMDELSTYDLVPFARNIKTMRAILVGHIWLPRLDSERKPATLSHHIVTEVLRNQLGFTGLAISDDMTMHAITRDYGLGEACVLAVLAGIDLILVCGTFGESQEAVAAIAAAISSGRIKKERMDEIFKRLDALFYARPETINPTVDREKLAALTKIIAADSEISTAFSAESIALLRGDLAKISGSDYLVIAPLHPRYPLPLAQALGASDLRYKLNPQQSDIDAVLQEAKLRNKKIVFVSLRTFINDGQENLARQLLQDKKLADGFIHVAADTPYDLLKIDAATSLATFDPSDQAMLALARVLTEDALNTNASCPVNLSLPN